MKQYKYTPYYVTEDGKVFRDGKEVKTWKTKKGYAYFSFNKTKKYIHRFVAELYIPNPENKPQVNHINCDKLDNRMENLEWVTNKENREHALKNGLMKYGEQYDHSKLTENDIKWIRENYIPKHPHFGGSALSRKFGVGNAQISRIVNKTRWKHL